LFLLFLFFLITIIIGNETLLLRKCLITQGVKADIHFLFAGTVGEAFVRLHEKGLIYQGITLSIFYNCYTVLYSKQDGNFL
jgi:Ca2+/Na+ antiporter